MWLALGDGDGRHLHSYLGLLNRHVRPRGLGCPFGAWAWCWLRWVWTVDGERQPSQGLPVKLLDGLATLMALAVERWFAPSPKAWPHLSAFSFGTCLNPSSIWAGNLLACVKGLGMWDASGLVLSFPSLGSDPSTHCTESTLVSKGQSCMRWRGRCD